MLNHKPTRRFGIILGLFFLASGLRAQEAVMPAAEEATITSDQLELVDNGSKSVFTGHVTLTRSPYVLTADRMVRTKATGIVEAEGHIVGTWLKTSGEKTTAIGERGRYNPQADTTELWKHARLTHWETVKDTAPLTVTADKFVAHHDQQVLLAEHHVIIRHGTTFESHSDEAKYDQQQQVIHLWGEHRTSLQWVDAQGSGHFLSDRALLYVSPKRARLIDNVTGHVIPNKS